MADQELVKLESEACANCQTELSPSDNYCPNCGQKVQDLRIGFWQLTIEFLSNNFNFDTRLGRSAVALVTSPGKLTKEFNEGKRANYVKPLQMYFFVSFVFFLMAGLLDQEASTDADLPSSIRFTMDGEQKDLLEITRTDSLGEEAAEEMLVNQIFDNDSLNDFSRKAASQLVKMTTPEGRNDLMDTLYSNVSIAMFVLMPWFGAILWLMVRKQNPFYIDSLIFSIHFHTVAFLLLLIELFFGVIYDSEATILIFGLLMMTYLIISLKTAFRFNWKRAIKRALMLSVMHLFSFSIMWITVLLISIWVF